MARIFQARSNIADASAALLTWRHRRWISKGPLYCIVVLCVVRFKLQVGKSAQPFNAYIENHESTTINTTFSSFWKGSVNYNTFKDFQFVTYEFCVRSHQTNKVYLIFVTVCELTDSQLPTIYHIRQQYTVYSVLRCSQDSLTIIWASK